MRHTVRYYIPLSLILILGLLVLTPAFADSQSFVVKPQYMTTYNVYLNQGVTLQFSVSVTGGSNNDINLIIKNPQGTVLVQGRVYSNYNSQIIATQSGNYQFIFDNSISIVSSKYVAFSSVVQNSGENNQANSGSSSGGNYGGYGSWDEYCKAKYGSDYYYDATRNLCVQSASGSNGGSSSSGNSYGGYSSWDEYCKATYGSNYYYDVTQNQCVQSTSNSGGGSGSSGGSYVQQPSKPVTTIQSGKVNWQFTDSMGNEYYWSMPLTTYDAFVQYHMTFPTWALTLPNGQTVYTYDYRTFINIIMARSDFRNVIDQVYNNAGSDDKFIYEVWYITSELTTYNLDMTNSNLWPIEVLTRGEGDCKDKSILIADMLRSSSHTSNWNINLEVMDSNNPDNPQTVNHMIVLVNTGQHNYAIEATATPDNNGLNVWAGKEIRGWQIPA